MMSTFSNTHRHGQGTEVGLSNFCWRQIQKLGGERECENVYKVRPSRQEYAGRTPVLVAF